MCVYYVMSHKSSRLWLIQSLYFTIREIDMYLTGQHSPTETGWRIHTTITHSDNNNNNNTDLNKYKKKREINDKCIYEIRVYIYIYSYVVKQQ